jgi:hypothetical protein
MTLICETAVGPAHCTARGATGTNDAHIDVHFQPCILEAGSRMRGTVGRSRAPQSCAACGCAPGLACVARLARLAAGGHVVSGPAVKKGPEVRAPASRRARTSAPRRRSTPLRPVYPLRFAMSARSFSSISGFDSAILRSSSRWYSRFSAWRLF